MNNYKDVEKSTSFFVRRIRERKFDMANNENVNKVIFGDQTVMDITDTTATEGDVVSGKTFYKASGARATGNAVIPDISNCYQTTDSTLSSIADEDYFPFLASQNIGKKKVSWAYIKTRLKVYFDSFYAAFTNTEAELRDTVGWVCKNKLDITLTYLKSINTAGTWSGNAYTHNGVTYTCSFNSEGYLSGITTSGTSSGASQLKLLYGTYSSFSSKYPQGSYYKFNGCPSGGASSGGFKMFFGIGSIATHDITSNVDYTFEIPTVGVYSGDYLTYSIEVASGVSMASKTFKPMIRDEVNGSSVYESYHKNVKSYVDESVSPKVSESLLKDTVGWVGKNEFDTSNITSGAALATINSDASSIKIKTTSAGTYKNTVFQMKATANKDYIFVCDADYTSGVGFVRIEDTNGNALATSSQITADGNVKLTFNSGNNTTLIVKLFCTMATSETGEVDFNNAMLYKADIKDDTYYPHHKSVEDWYWENNPNAGAKNRLPIPSSVVTKTDNEVTFTVTRNSKGEITEIDVDSNGQTTAGFRSLSLISWGEKILPEGKWILSDVNGGANAYTYINRKKGASGSVNYDIGTSSASSVRVSVNYDTYDYFVVGIGVPSGKVADHVKLYPMLRDARDTDSTYQPYAMTNRELTDEVALSETQFATNFTADRNHIYKWGNIVEYELKLNDYASTGDFATVAGTLPQGYRPSGRQIFSTAFVGGGIGLAIININTNGEITVAGTFTARTLVVHGSFIRNLR